MRPTNWVHAMDKPRVSIIFTGGTIDSLGRDRLDMLEYADLRRWLEPEALLATIPELADVATITHRSLGRFGLASMAADDFVTLHDVVTSSAEEGAQGIVVTHGTNFLEETSYFLSLSLKIETPVVFAASMRPASAMSSDSSINFLNAVRVAASPEAAGMGALVVLNDAIHAARDVTKAATHSLDAFQSRNYGPLGFVGPDGKVEFYRDIRRKHTLATEFDLSSLSQRTLPRVDVVPSYYGADGVMIDAVVAAGARGIVSAGLGAGKATPEQNDALDRARRQGVVVVQSARAGTGRVLVETRLKSRNIVAADDLSPWKARILLMLALTRTNDPEAIQSMFLTY